jgi:two-component system KDP operon response regulator KdpE
MLDKSRILVINDEPNALATLQHTLAQEGFDLVVARDAISGIHAAYHTHPDAILLGTTMPDMDGYEACRRLRHITNVPILLVARREATTEDVVEGFSAGADDYMNEPIHDAELMGRLTASMRRSPQRTERRARFISPAPSLILDCDRRELLIGARSVHLSPIEFRVLEFLMRHPGQTLTRDAILARVWGAEHIREVSFVKQCVHQLRKKIEPDPDSPQYILSDWGEGYFFQVPDRRAAVRMTA